MLITATEVRNNAAVRRFDYDATSNLELWSYTSCNDASDEATKNSRGIVLHNDAVVSRMFGYSTEIPIGDNLEDSRAAIEAQLADKLRSCLCFASVEGSLVRLFNFEGKWYLSTFRKLDAFHSKWQSSRTFGELFKEGLKNTVPDHWPDTAAPLDAESRFADLCLCLERLENYQDLTHTFILPSTKETRQVVEGTEKQTILYSGSFSRDGTYSRCIPDSVIPWPPRYEFSTIDDLFALLSRPEEVAKMQQGLMFIHEPSGWNMKLVFSQYQKLQKVRGNTPSVTARFIDVYADEVQREELRRMFPERGVEFRLIDADLHSACRGIHRIYMDRHIHKKQVVVHPLLNYMDKTLHGMYITDGQKITTERVWATMMQQTPKTLHILAQLASTLFVGR